MNFYKKKKVVVKRSVSLLLAASMLLAVPVGHEYGFWHGERAYADLQSDRDEAQNQLNDIKNNLANMEAQMSALEGQLGEKAAVLSDLLAEKAILENDIANTQAAIEQAEKDLIAAKEQEAEAYEAMKLRIQYMYENSTHNSMWEAIINAEGIVDLLNRVEYVTQVHKTDRELMEEYKAVVVEVETLAAELDEKMNNLVTLQEVYEHQEAELETAMAALREEADDFEMQIAAANQRAVQLSDYIEEQNRLIRLEEEEKRRREEEEKRRLEEQKKKEEEEKRRLEEQKKKEEEQKKQEEEKKEEQYKGEQNVTTAKPSQKEDSASSVTGQELVNYALQFVGNPYKWGGNSLTNGCDCSGFVSLIYKHFGFKNVPRQSQAFKSYGRAVSFADIQPGDIVVYPGHVAIYIGNGKIVEAQSSKAGITSNRSVTCSTITAIRRVL